MLANSFHGNTNVAVFQTKKFEKVNSLIDDNDIKLEFLAWIRLQKPSRRTASRFQTFVNEMIIPNYEHSNVSRISRRTASSWLNALGCLITDTEKKKGSSYVDEDEQKDVVEYRNRFCNRWFKRYLPRMENCRGERWRRLLNRIWSQENVKSYQSFMTSVLSSSMNSTDQHDMLNNE